MQDEQPTAVALNEKDVELECFKRGNDCEFRGIDYKLRPRVLSLDVDEFTIMGLTRIGRYETFEGVELRQNIDRFRIESFNIALTSKIQATSIFCGIDQLGHKPKSHFSCNRKAAISRDIDWNIIHIRTP